MLRWEGRAFVDMRITNELSEMHPPIWDQPFEEERQEHNQL